MKLFRFSTLCYLVLMTSLTFAQQKIDRKALVERHQVNVQRFDTLASLSVGNGRFAFTVDATGLQTFPSYYANGIPLGTQSEWGWHAFPNKDSYHFEESLRIYESNGRKIPYGVQIKTPEHAKAACGYFRENPHRLQLGNFGFYIKKADGREALLSDIKIDKQTLNPWTGEISSSFSVEGIPVSVTTYCHQEKDLIAVKVKSALLKSGRLKLKLRFPFPSNEFTDYGTNYKNDQQHQSFITKHTEKSVHIRHRLDTTRYTVQLSWSSVAEVSIDAPHTFLISPVDSLDTFEAACLFTEKPLVGVLPIFEKTAESSRNGWKSFWMRGGAVDFSGSADIRAKELERRVILSQYLTKIQCSGAEPPQETGLTYNSWFGKPHLEMHWWHGVHFALWNRIDLLENSLSWYAKVASEAKAIAKRQGFEGVRWQKMTDPAGKESPSSVGALLIWQQPHFIYFAELCRREHQDLKTLQKYKDLVFATADFMASFAYFDKEKGRYILGKGLIPAQERFKAEDTFNPTYELAYWQWALSVAQDWRVRLNLPRNKKWDDVMQKISPLPQQNGVYLAAESAPDSYTNPVYLTDHPSVLGTFGMLPTTPLLNKKVMRQTFDKVWTSWNWKDTWGWDFPMVAMTAARLGLPEKAIDGLMMNIRTNTYLPNGHNFQDERLRLYLPGNGGLLAAVAMMCAGFEDGNQNAGIPKNSQWNVRWEGLKQMP